MHNKKNIGVSTLHYGFNEGAILQSYALTKLISYYIKDSKAFIVDQRYPSKVDVYGEADDERKKSLLDAINNWLPLSNIHFRESGNKKVFQYLNDQLSALIVGSDVVWSLKYKRRFRRVLSKGIFPTQPYPFFPPFPNVYWPDISVKIPKFSYAASIGTMDWEQIPRKDIYKMNTILDDFKMLGVRDERTQEFIEFIDKSLTPKIKLVPDPTLGVNLLSDKIKISLRVKLENMGVDFSRPRCGIICGDHSPVSFTIEKLKKKGYQIIGISTKNTFSDINLFNQGFHPLEWANLFGLMNICIVERMHGSIFCIKNGVPFIALDNYETDKDDNSKIKSLMRRFDLEDYCLSKKKISGEMLLQRTIEISDGFSVEKKEFISNKLKQLSLETKSFFECVETYI